MEQNIKLKVLNSIGKIYDQSKDCKLLDSFFKKTNVELSFLSDYFKTTKSQSFFISIIFALNYKGDTVDLNDMIEYFDCNPMKILEYSDDFKFLHSSGVFIKQKSNHRINLAGANDQFTINEKISEAILNNKPITNLNDLKLNDIFELLEKLYKLGEQRDDDEITSRQLFKQTINIISENKHFPLIKKIDQLNFQIHDSYLYLYLIWKTISGRESTDIGIALKGIYDNSTKRIKNMQRILSGENILIKNDYIEIVEARFFNDTEMKLTNKSYDILKECGINLFTNKKKKDNVIEASDIPFRKLIFSKDEMKQLFLLKDLLKDKKFTETQKRLSSNNLPKGINILLHGSPGTGKTEIAKQIAKETKRSLMKVEISKSKSMWFGESEKIIKRIFTEYKSYAKECKKTPILFFNEADAIISKRREVGNSNVDKTENTIQNILLEELENFEGILMATTNLVNNLDSAFERRFLYKIKFKKPDPEIRAKIWKLKLSDLKIKDCRYLSDKFNFSGGQIDNVVRKINIFEVLYDRKPQFSDIIEYCEVENFEKEDNVSIGFRR